MISRKRQRLFILSSATLVVAGAVLLIIFALGGDSFSLFREPSDLVENPVAPGQRVRLGGLVADGSLARAEDGVTFEFTVTDCAADVRVVYTGILPDLFREGQGVISEGVFTDGGLFKADTVLAKHDENYKPAGSDLPDNTDACTHPDQAAYTAQS